MPIGTKRTKSLQLSGVHGTRIENLFTTSCHRLLDKKKEGIDMNAQLQQYFEFAANIWLSFAPGEFKEKFPRNFRFTVTVPHSFLGELPPELKGVAQLEVSVEAYDRENAAPRTDLKVPINLMNAVAQSNQVASR